MYNPRLIRKMVRCFLLTDNIKKIGLYMGSIKVQCYHCIFHIGQKCFNILKSVLYIQKSAVDQEIILNKSMMS